MLADNDTMSELEQPKAQRGRLVSTQNRVAADEAFIPDPVVLVPDLRDAVLAARD